MASNAVAFGALLGGAIVLEYGIRSSRQAFSSSGSTTTSDAGVTAASGSVANQVTTTGDDTPEGWAGDLLQSLDAPLTEANISSVVAWEGREGGWWHNTAEFNPLNTTYSMPGATSVNGVGVKAYTSKQQGLEATVSTLKNGDYSDIVSALQSGQGLAGKSYQGLSTWSGGGYSSV